MRITISLLLVLMFSACSSTTGPSQEYLAAQAAVAVSNPARPATDQDLDQYRKPSQVLGFLGIQPGMQVIDIFGGGGYYTEIVSYLVGDSGRVTLYNNNPWNQFVRKQVDERLKDNRLANVNSLIAEPHELSEVSDQYDAGLFIMGMHDIYYEDAANGWTAIDPRGFLLNIQRLIRPGGVLGIIDHNALAGTDPAETGKTLHRMDPARIIADVEAAGFTLEAESDLLRNAEDDLTGLVFAPELRWRTDRSLLKFRKN